MRSPLANRVTERPPWWVTTMVPGRLATAVGTAAAATEATVVESTAMTSLASAGAAVPMASAAASAAVTVSAVIRDRYVVIMMLPLVRPGMGR